eukprot:Tamp_31553.p1 GENE.Tamp_31553~~Tamp_31553.p1  ORF type:complete len:164 (+),score=22.73 Tamp_31553:44-535(+)
MGWEWRLFYHGDLRAAFRDHVAARLPTLRRKGDDELRTDVYVSCTHTTGAKARGSSAPGAGGEIEIKRRSLRKKRGAEHWTKVIVPAQDMPTGTTGSLIDAGSAALLGRVKKVLQHDEWHEQTAVPVCLTKCRTMFKVYAEDGSDAVLKGFKGTKIECTLVCP